MSSCQALERWIDVVGEKVESLERVIENPTSSELRLRPYSSIDMLRYLFECQTTEASAIVIDQFGHRLEIEAVNKEHIKSLFRVQKVLK